MSAGRIDVDLVVEDDVVLGHLLAEVGDEGVTDPGASWPAPRRRCPLADLVGLDRPGPLPVDRGGAGEETVSMIPVNRAIPKPGPQLSVSMRPGCGPRGVAKSTFDRIRLDQPS